MVVRRVDIGCNTFGKKHWLFLRYKATDSIEVNVTTAFSTTDIHRV